ncbi:MAG: hypothetical protein IJ642_08835 [Oscillospiraceae bacterium]|nr:hypothetical protein [Oscillospiraceae bacterium]
MKKIIKAFGKFLLILFGIPICLLMILLLIDKAKESADKSHNQEKITLAEQNAAEWIQKKYGISAQAVSAEVDVDDSGLFYTDYLDEVTVVMQAGGKNFDVHISGTKEHAQGADNYQYDKICAGIMELISEEIPNGTLAYFNYGYLNLCQAYFDGTNLKEVLSDTSSVLYVGFVNTDFSEDLPVFDTLMKMNIKASFTSFASEEILREALAFDTGGTAFEKYVNYFAPYITNQRYIDYPKNEQRFFKLNTHDNFLYYLPYENLFSDDWAFQKTDLSWIQDKTSVLAAYQITGTCPHIVIFYPISEISDEIKQNLQFTYTETLPDDTEWQQCSEISGCHHCGEYAAFELHYGHHLRFAFFT